MSDDKKQDETKTHEGSMGTDRNGPAGTEDAQLDLTDEQIKLKRRIEELRKRDPFIYR